MFNGTFDPTRIDDQEMLFTNTDVSYVSHRWRLEEELIVLEYTLGPLEVRNRLQRIGKEVFSRFTFPDTTESSVLWTDTNSYGFIDRDRSDIRPLEPTASRYMPITAQAYLKSGSDTCFTVTTDRSAGVTSLQDDQFDI